MACFSAMPAALNFLAGAWMGVCSRSRSGSEASVSHIWGPANLWMALVLATGLATPSMAWPHPRAAPLASILSSGGGFAIARRTAPR